MKNIKLLILVISIALLAGKASAQYPLFSQFYNVPPYYNPAVVGLSPGLRARLAVRDQWPQLPGDLQNLNFSMDIAERNIPGIGRSGFIGNER